MSLVEFKSTTEFFRKEYFGLKNNTLRTFDKEDHRKDILDDFRNGHITILGIRIVNKDTNEQFIRKVIDVSYYEGWYIITWAI